MNTTSWAVALSGALMMAYAMAGLFFLRYWTRTRDRLFAVFALAFWVLVFERVLLIGVGPDHEMSAYIYSIRLVAFMLILGAIIDKNRHHKRHP